MPFSAPVQEKKDEQASSPLRPLWQTALAAGLGGAAAGLLFFFSEGTKKKLQTGQVLSFSPREILRGAPAFATSVGTSSVAQLTANAYIQSIEGFDPHSNLHNGAAALVSGTIGGVASTFIENNILYQQLHKCGPISAMQGLLKEGISRPCVGMAPLMLREQGFGLTMLFIAPLAAKYASEKWGTSWENPAKIVFGMCGGVLTHGPDTIASRMQLKQVSMLQAIRSIYQENGVKGFFKGVAWRAGILFPGCAIAIPAFTEAAKKGIDKIRDAFSQSDFVLFAFPKKTVMSQPAEAANQTLTYEPRRP